MRSQPRRLQLVVSNRKVNLKALSHVKCAMLSVPLHRSRWPLKEKLDRLQRRSPEALVVIERLVDDLLAEVS